MSPTNYPKAVITDFDNTLVMTQLFIKDHIKKTCKRIGVKPPSDKKIDSVLKRNLPFEEIFSRLFGKKGDKVLRAYRENAMQTHYKEVPGGVNFIKKLHSLGVHIIIVSNRTNKLRERLGQAGYNPDWFLAITSPDERKPSKKAYLPSIKLLQEKGVNKEEIVFLGDSIDDYEACPDNLKSNFYAILTNPSSKKDFLEKGVSKNNMLKSLQKLEEKIK